MDEMDVECLNCICALDVEEILEMFKKTYKTNMSTMGWDIGADWWTAHAAVHPIFGEVVLSQITNRKNGNFVCEIDAFVKKRVIYMCYILYIQTGKRLKKVD